MPKKHEIRNSTAEFLIFQVESKKQGVEVILDDRNQGLGFKAKDWELIGIPFQVIVGKRASEGIVEFKDRQTLEKIEITVEEAVSKIVEAVKNM